MSKFSIRKLVPATHEARVVYKGVKSFIPSEIVAMLDKYVVGQDEAKKELAIAVTNHHYITQYNQDSLDIQLRTANVLLAGSTGSGKTLLVRTLAKVLDVPILVVDITGFSQTGYVGREIDEIFSDLYETTDGNMSNAIIFIDELDKIGTHGSDANVSTTGVQRGLLKLLDGGIQMINVSGQRGGSRVEFDTSTILWVFGGSFASVIDEKKKVANTSMGFGAADSAAKKSYKVTHAVLKEAGLIPELIGRIGSVATLEDLSEDDLARIVVEPVDSIYNQYKKLGEIRGINLTLTKEDVTTIVKETIKMGTGARGLRVVADRLMKEKMYI